MHDRLWLDQDVESTTAYSLFHLLYGGLDINTLSEDFVARLPQSSNISCRYSFDEGDLLDCT